MKEETETIEKLYSKEQCIKNLNQLIELVDKEEKEKYKEEETETENHINKINAARTVLCEERKKAYDTATTDIRKFELTAKNYLNAYEFRIKHNFDECNKCLHCKDCKKPLEYWEKQNKENYNLDYQI